jgi:hypothetical protein
MPSFTIAFIVAAVLNTVLETVSKFLHRILLSFMTKLLSSEYDAAHPHLELPSIWATVSVRKGCSDYTRTGRRS